MVSAINSPVRWLTWLLLGLLLGHLVVGDARGGRNRHGIAVIIGNKTYAGSIPAVDFAHNDAKAIRDYVVGVLGYREGNLIDLRDASLADLRKVFGDERSHEGQLFDWVRAGKSDVFVFYSGHGVPGLKDRRGYLLPADGDANRAEFTGYPLDTLYDNLRKIPANSVTAVIDACFSGETPRGMLVRATSGISIVAKAARTAGLTVLTAARGDQVASWDEAAKRGLFTEYFLRAVRGAADGEDYGNGDGRVTLAEIRTYLNEEMTYQARRRYGREQTPTITGLDNRVLASLPKDRATLPPSKVEFQITELDRVLYVSAIGKVNVREGPGTRYPKLATLQPSVAVDVTGKVVGKDWYRVTLSGGVVGYIWRNLLTSRRQDGGPARSDARPAAGPPLNENEIASIRPQFQRCWSVPAWARGTKKNLFVQIRVFLNPDGSLAKAPEIERSPRDSDPLYRTLAESARRAVLKCAPLRHLPMKKYARWRELVLTFNPEDMLGEDSPPTNDSSQGRWLDSGAAPSSILPRGTPMEPGAVGR